MMLLVGVRSAFIRNEIRWRTEDLVENLNLLPKRKKTQFFHRFVLVVWRFFSLCVSLIGQIQHFFMQHLAHVQCRWPTAVFRAENYIIYL